MSRLKSAIADLAEPGAVVAALHRPIAVAEQRPQARRIEQAPPALLAAVRLAGQMAHDLGIGEGRRHRFEVAFAKRSEREPRGLEDRSIA